MSKTEIEASTKAMNRNVLIFLALLLLSFFGLAIAAGSKSQSDDPVEARPSSEVTTTTGCSGYFGICRNVDAAIEAAITGN
jgi:hypothetical protein